MTKLATHGYLKTSVTLLLFFLLFSLSTINVKAQIYVSKSADFSTRDRSFEPTETLYIMVRAQNLYAGDLDKNELRLTPESGENEFITTFANKLDGTYTQAILLASLDQTQTNWVIRLRLKDENNREIRADISIGVNMGCDGPDGTECVKRSLLLSASRCATKNTHPKHDPPPIEPISGPDFNQACLFYVTV